MSEIKSKDLLDQYLNGASEPVAYAIWISVPANAKPEIADLLVLAALLPRKVIVSNGIDVKLSSVGFRLGQGEYNHTMAKIAGCMLLEKNNHPRAAEIMKKIGGRSPFSATKLQGESAKIRTENNEMIQGALASTNNWKIAFVPAS
jgi:hypothetical protein